MTELAAVLKTWPLTTAGGMPVLHIGLIGHHDIVVSESLDSELRSAFSVLQAAFAEAAARPYVKMVLHAVADTGADRFVLDAFFAWFEGRQSPGIKVELRLLAIDTVPELAHGSVSERDADTAALLRRLDELSQTAHFDYTREIVPALRQVGNRDQYAEEFPCARLAEYFRNNCDVVLALWDGVWDTENSGTSQVVNLISRLDSRQHPGRRCRDILCLRVAREGNPFPAGDLLTWQTFFMGAASGGRIFPRAKKWLKRHWKEISLFLLAAVSISFGVLGLLKEYHLESASDAVGFISLIIDAFMVSATFLVLENFENVGESGTAAEWIRYSHMSAILFAILAAGFLLDAAFRILDRIKLWFVSLRPHDLICGLGWHGSSLIENEGAGVVRTIAVESAPGVAVRDQCARLRVSLLVEDACDNEVLGSTGIARLRRAFICTGSDESNMRIAHRLAQVYPRGHAEKRLWMSQKEKKTPPLVCAVSLQSPKSFQTLWNALPPGHNLDLRAFHTVSATVRALLRENHLDRFRASPSAKGAQMVLVGDGPMADEILLKSLQVALFEEGKSFRVDVLCVGAQHAAEHWCRLHPCFNTVKGADMWIAEPEAVWLREAVLPFVYFHELSPSSRKQIEWCEQYCNDPDWVTTVIVAVSDPSESSTLVTDISAKLDHLRQSAGGKGKDIALWFYFNSRDQDLREDIEQTINKDFPGLPVRVFFDFLGPCNRRVATGEDVDSVARRIHAMYCHDDREKPVEQLTKAEIDARWMQCSENDKDSNRLAAEHAWVKTRIKNRSKLSKIATEEALARIEHRRWCAEYLLKGFQPLTRIPQVVMREQGDFSLTEQEGQDISQWFAVRQFKKANKARKRHIDLIPFDDLPLLLGDENGQKEQQKDLRQVKLLDWLIGASGGFPPAD